MFHSVGRCSGSDILRSGLNVDEDVGSFRVRDEVLLYAAVFSSILFRYMSSEPSNVHDRGHFRVSPLPWNTVVCSRARS